MDQEQKTETEHTSGFHSRETLYLSALMLIYFLTFNTYKYAFPLFPFYPFDNDYMKSSKRHAVLLSLAFLFCFFSRYIGDPSYTPKIMATTLDDR